MQDSFFDTDMIETKLMMVLPEDPCPKHNEVLWSDVLLSAGEKYGQSVKNYAIVTQSHLHVYSSSDKTTYLGSLDFADARCYFSIIDSKMYEITFRRNLLSLEFITKDENVFYQMKEALNFLCIQTDFHSKYKPLHLLGKGNFGEVWAIEDIKTSKQYAAKQFDKNVLKTRKLAKNYLKSEIEIMKKLDHPS